MWWRTVYIGSLTFPPWSGVNNKAPLKQVYSIFKRPSPPKYLLVVQSVVPLKLVGVVTPNALEEIISKSSDENLLQQPLTKVEGAITTNFKLVQIAGGTIADVSDAFKDGCAFVILFRNTKIVTENNEQQAGTSVSTCSVVQRMHPIAVVTKNDLKRWIVEVEGHHNMESESEETISG